MRRSTFLATFLALVGSASMAAADSAPSPPPPLDVQGVNGMFTVGDGPHHATYTLTNRSALPMEVFLDRVLYREGRYNVPLRIHGVSRAEGGDLGRRFTVPANGSVRCVVTFEEARGRGERFPLTLRVMMSGRRVEGTATLTRATRIPTKEARRKGA